MSSLPRARISELAGLARRRERARLGLFLVEGVRGVESAVDAGAPLTELIVTEAAASVSRVGALADKAGIPVSRVSERDMARLSDVRSAQGVVAIARSVVLDFDAESPPSGAVVVLDGVQDPGNVGTIVRTAAWFGVSAVVVGPGTADPESPKVARSAAGALWDLTLLRADGLADALGALGSAGRRLYGADVPGTSVAEWTPPDDAVLVLGGEANGLSAGARSHLAHTVAIPRAGLSAGVESLNVAVAAGILLHSWRGGRDH
jgi:TrmH family RNA methyltransferase